MDCLGANTVAALLEGRLQGEERHEVTGHVRACSACNGVLAMLAQTSFGEMVHGTPPSAPDAIAAGVPDSSWSDSTLARAVDAPAFMPGARLADRYEVVRFIARGGMGEVYEVQDLALGERVALKTLRAGGARDAASIELFKRELQLARKVTHPNVCRVFDVGFHRGRGAAGGTETETVFLTMELLGGETLAARLRRMRRMTETEALPLVRQMAAALGAAHRAGIVHRDFKSENVFLVPDAGEEGGARVVVTDFGLAYSASGDGGASGGAIVGTPVYMAPEQVEGGAITPAADIYALGVVLYEMVTGEWPFRAATPMKTAMLRLEQPPPSPRSRVPELDPRWEMAILRCLARRPADRFAGAEEIAGALAAPPSHRRRVRGYVTAAAIVLGTAAVPAWRLLRARPPAATGSGVVAPPSAQVSAARVSPPAPPAPSVPPAVLPKNHPPHPAATSLTARSRPIAADVPKPGGAAVPLAIPHADDRCAFDVVDERGEIHHYGGRVETSFSTKPGTVFINESVSAKALDVVCVAWDEGKAVSVGLSLYHPELETVGSHALQRGADAQFDIKEPSHAYPPEGFSAAVYTSAWKGASGTYTVDAFERRPGAKLSGSLEGTFLADTGGRVSVHARFDLTQR